jgi:hypothetical protein
MGDVDEVVCDGDPRTDRLVTDAGASEPRSLLVDCARAKTDLHFETT